MTTKQDLLKKRPTSPHLSIYKPQITSILSIMHRITGVALYFSLIILSWVLISYIFWGECKFLMLIFEMKIFCLSLVLVSYALIYHIHTGIRHLFWDVGYGFSIEAINRSGWLIVVSSIILTTLFWYFLV